MNFYFVLCALNFVLAAKICHLKWDRQSYAAILLRLVVCYLPPYCLLTGGFGPPSARKSSSASLLKGLLG
jgi:hypothetical protein